MECGHMFTDKKTQDLDPFQRLFKVLPTCLVDFVRVDSSVLRDEASLVQHSEAIMQSNTRRHVFFLSYEQSFPVCV